MDIEINTKIKNLLNEFIIPDTGRPLKEIGKIVSFVSEGNKCKASMEFGYHAVSYTHLTLPTILLV